MSDTVTIEQELPTLEARGTELAAKIPLIRITDPESFAMAVEDRAEIKRRLARIEEVMGPICASAHATWKTAVAKREGLRVPFVDADKAYSRAMGLYEQEQERQRRAAEEQARRDRERLEAEERQRVEAENARLRKEAEDTRLEEAAAAEARGDTETAERLIAAPVAAPTVTARPVFVPVAPAPPKPAAAGVSFRDSWTAEVVDLLVLVKAVAGKCPTCRCTAPHPGQPVTLLAPNQAALNGLARSLKGALAIPGVRAVNERIAAQKA